MCLIVFAWQVVPGTALIAAGNRDEFYERPTKPATWWDDHPEVYAGRDLRAGGTWIGITKHGRFAALTNIRNPAEKKRPDAPSRGALVAGFLTGHQSPESYISEITPRTAEYNGFNLLLGDRKTLVWYSNGTDDPRNGKPLAPGVYGLSNGSLDSPWPKVVRTKAQFASLLCQGAPEEAYFEMLTDTTRASDCRLPKTGVSLEWERVLSAVCIESPEYGTRASTVVQLYADEGAVLHERIIR
jgi:uncharacterized protein with NRDE domain